MTVRRDAEFECEMSVREEKFSSSRFFLRLSSVFSFILILVLLGVFCHIPQLSVHPNQKMIWPV